MITLLVKVFAKNVNVCVFQNVPSSLVTLTVDKGQLNLYCLKGLVTMIHCARFNDCIHHSVQKISMFEVFRWTDRRPEVQTGVSDGRKYGRTSKLQTWEGHYIDSLC